MVTDGVAVVCLLLTAACCSGWGGAGDSQSAHNVSYRRPHFDKVAKRSHGNDYTRYSVFRLRPTEEQRQLVRGFYNKEGFDVWARGARNYTYVDIMVYPAKKRSFEDFLVRNNIAHTILIENVQETLKRETANLTRPCGGLFCQYNRYDTITRFMRETERRRPRQVRVESLGLTHEGRDILVMQISGDGGAAGRPVVLLEAGVHAREWIAPAAALRVMQGLAEDPRQADLLRHLDWHVVPVLNPDGYEYSYTTSRFWRKNRGKNKGSQCRGNDINRNFDFHWNEVGTSPDPCSDGYPGPRPFSSLESIALKNYALKHKHRIKLYLSLHSHGSHSVAVKADEAQVKAGGLPYVIGSSAKTLYPAAGCTDDWMKAVCGVNLSYTVELPGGGKRGFDLPPEYIEDTVNNFFHAVRAFGKELERLLLSSIL